MICERSNILCHGASWTRVALLQVMLALVVELVALRELQLQHEPHCGDVEHVQFVNVERHPHSLRKPRHVANLRHTRAIRAVQEGSAPKPVRCCALGICLNPRSLNSETNPFSRMQGRPRLVGAVRLGGGAAVRTERSGCSRTMIFDSGPIITAGGPFQSP